MIRVPAFLYWLLCRIPFVGSSFRRIGRAKQSSASWVNVPVKSFWQAGQKSLILVLIIGLGAMGAWYWLGNLPDNALENASAGNVEENSKLAVLLEKLEQTGSSNVDDSSAHLLLLDERISIADEIIALEPDSATENIAATAKLTAVIRRSLIEIELGIDDGRHSLQQISGDFINSEDQQINGLANLCVVVDAIKEYVNNSEQDVDSVVKNAAIEKIKWTAEANDNNISFAAELLDVLRSLNEHTEAETMKPLYNAFVTGFRNSNLPEIVALIDSVRDNFDFSDGELISVRSATRANQDQVVAKLMQQVKDILSGAEGVLPLTAEKILDRTNDLLSISRPDKAKEILNQLSQSTVITPEIAERMKLVQRKIGLFSKPVDLTGLLDVSDNQVSFSDRDTKLKMLFFTRTDPSANPVGRIKTLLKLVNPALKRSELELSLVCVHADNDPDESIGKQRFVDDNQNLGIWFLYSNSVSGKSFLESCPLDKLPYAVIMDQDLKVISMGPQPRILMELLSKQDN